MREKLNKEKIEYMTLRKSLNMMKDPKLDDNLDKKRIRVKLPLISKGLYINVFHKSEKC